MKVTVILILLYFFRSGKTDQIFLTTQGFLTSAYHYVQCPVPVLKWLFRVREIFGGIIASYCISQLKTNFQNIVLLAHYQRKKLMQHIKPIISVVQNRQKGQCKEIIKKMLAQVMCRIMLVVANMSLMLVVPETFHHIGKSLLQLQRRSSNAYISEGFFLSFFPPACIHFQDLAQILIFPLIHIFFRIQIQLSVSLPHSYLILKSTKIIVLIFLLSMW